MSVISNIRGTFEELFRLGKGGPQLKKDGTHLASRDATDAAYANMRGADPVIADDLITKRYFDANATTTATNWVKLPIATAGLTSTTAIPNGVIIRDVILHVTTPYDNAATIKAERTGDATKILIDTGDNDPSIADEYHQPQVQSYGATGAGTVTVTVTGTPTVGSAILYIGYMTPNDIT